MTYPTWNCTYSEYYQKYYNVSEPCMHAHSCLCKRLANVMLNLKP
jgi:hypothetical protein